MPGKTKLLGHEVLHVANFRSLFFETESLEFGMIHRVRTDGPADRKNLLEVCGVLAEFTGHQKKSGGYFVVDQELHGGGIFDYSVVDRQKDDSIGGVDVIDLRGEAGDRNDRGN